ncbi:MAG: hypothetical protein IJZ03_09210 [Clostridia bacterium]|nr:hypothetical protein [Clostridia bacterium]MBQ8743529.1 hypothetical protein [Clostridia bacterium]
MERNIDKIIGMVEESVKKHEISTGKYCRWLWQDAKGSRNLGSSEYGCADAANILYTIGKFPKDPEIRAEFVKELRSFQKEDGCFSEPTHHFLHSTAHCTAALELFDASPKYPLTYHMENFGTPEKMISYLESLGWVDNPWGQSHRGAGLFAAMILTCNMPLTWQDAYFTWLSENNDPVTGIGRKNHGNVCSLQEHLNGWFHYLFNHVFAHRPFPSSENLIDSCIDMYKDFTFVTRFGKEIGFSEIDWVFVINRASRDSGYRRQEVLELLRDFAEKYFDYFESIDVETDERFNDLHMLFGAVCAISELQIALPGEIKSSFPLKNVLDRRPFI